MPITQRVVPDLYDTVHISQFALPSTAVEESENFVKTSVSCRFVGDGSFVSTSIQSVASNKPMPAYSFSGAFGPAESEALCQDVRRSSAGNKRISGGKRATARQAEAKAWIAPAGL